MRDYPTVPNVFRLTSSHSINNNINHTHDTNGNSNTNNNNINIEDNQPRLGVATTMELVAPTNQPAAVTTQAIVHGEVGQDVGIAGCENVAIRINYPHKLTTAASIERHYQQAAAATTDLSSDRRVAHTPSQYATLPRGLQPASVPVVNGDLHAHLQQRGRALAIDEQRIINTISGSIPSTGFTTITTANLDRSGSLGSDLNTSLMDFSQLHSLDSLPKSALQQKHQHQQQQQQQPRCREFRLLPADTADYQQFEQPCRLDTKQFAAMGRSSENGYLWILTPVAAR